MDLLQVAAHEFGHVLGLQHTRTKGAIMSPHYFFADFPPRISNDDKWGIQHLYGSRRVRAPEPQTTTATTTTTTTTATTTTSTTTTTTTTESNEIFPTGVSETDATITESWKWPKSTQEVWSKPLPWSFMQAFVDKTFVRISLFAYVISEYTISWLYYISAVRLKLVVIQFNKQLNSFQNKNHNKIMVFLNRTTLA